MGEVERLLDRGIAAADTTTSLPRKKKPSQVAQAETPKPRNVSSLGRPSQRAWAPVQIASVSAT